MRRGGYYSTALVAYLCHHSQRFKINNMNVMKATLGLLLTSTQYAADDRDSCATAGYEAFSKPAAWCIIKHLLCKSLWVRKGVIFVIIV